MKVNDHVKKKVDERHRTRFVGRILSIYKLPPEMNDERDWCVVLLDKNEASDQLQHLYPLELFELV